MPETWVISLGGNVITREDEPGRITDQFTHTAEILDGFVDAFRQNYRLVLTHGNGPQMGNILIRVEEGERRVPPLPLDTCVADSQGGMGYMMQRLADQLFRREGIKRDIATLITQVIVDETDPDFRNPTKPIGSFYSAADVELIRREKPHWILKEIEPGRFRRVVPSPRPLDVVEKDAIACLLDAGFVVIACGGGGIAVAWEQSRLAGLEAVVDKDLASGLLARQLKAQRLIIITTVHQVALSYRKPGQCWLSSMSAGEARRYLAAGEFPAGSMGPKITAGIEVVEAGGVECLITSPDRVREALAGRDGTRITAN
jgi:carbamate kinase